MKIKILVSIIALALAPFALMQPAYGQTRQTKRPVAPVATPTPTPTATIRVQAGLIYRSGDVKPVARTTFILLDKPLVGLFVDDGCYVDGTSPLVKSIVTPYPLDHDTFPRSILLRYAVERSLPHDGEALRASYSFRCPDYMGTMKRVASHVVVSGETGFDGRLEFRGIPYGQYWIYGDVSDHATYFPEPRVIWHTRIEEVSKPEVEVILDNNNAAYIAG
jgi:hypothetical protein